MRLAVVDANIFIDLIRLKLLDHFFEIGFEIQTTDLVFNQLNESQQDQLQQKVEAGKIMIHALTASETSELMAMRFPSKLEIADCTVFYFAQKLNGLLVSGDNCLRKHCQSKNVEVHGLVWVFEQLHSLKIISPDILLEKSEIYLAYAQRAPKTEFHAFQERLKICES